MTTQPKPNATTKTKETNMTDTKKIYPALAAVMKGMANIPKNGTMKFGTTSYAYLRSDDVQERLNPLLVENNIVVKSDYSVRDTTKGNREWVYVDLMLTYISVHDGSELSVTASGESVAGDDKSINKALTQAIKNCHRAMFQFASGEDEPDNHASGKDATVEPAAIAAAKRAPRATPPAKAPTAELPAKQKVLDEYLTPEKVTRADAGTLLNSAKTLGLTGDAQYEYVLELCPVLVAHPSEGKRIDEIAKLDYSKKKKVEGLGSAVKDALALEGK